MSLRHYYVYILTNKNKTVLYTGVTSNIKGRMWQHKHKVLDGFTKRYNVDQLMYVEVFPTAMEAITREKQIKAGSRQRKIKLINDYNPSWKDLSDDLDYE